MASILEHLQQNGEIMFLLEQGNPSAYSKIIEKLDEFDLFKTHFDTCLNDKSYYFAKRTQAAILMCVLYGILPECRHQYEERISKIKHFIEIDSEIVDEDERASHLEVLNIIPSLSRDTLDDYLLIHRPNIFGNFGKYTQMINEIYYIIGQCIQRDCKEDSHFCGVFARENGNIIEESSLIHVNLNNLD